MAARARCARRIRIPVRDDQRRPPESARRSGRGAVQALGAAAFVHLSLFGALSATADVAAPPEREDIQIALISEPPLPPEPVEIAPEPEPEPEPEPVAEPEPIEEPAPAEVPEVAAEPAERVVGLSADSTIAGGDGPRYAIGNTRMGRTARTAADPAAVSAAPPPPAPRPISTGRVKKPRRIGRVELPYPPELEARGIEADVPVEVDIDAGGSVVAVRILVQPEHPEFARSAEVAARSQSFKPATQGGAPVPYTLSYTYRFRITS